MGRACGKVKGEQRCTPFRFCDAGKMKTFALFLHKCRVMALGMQTSVTGKPPTKDISFVNTGFGGSPTRNPESYCFNEDPAT
jgi:hypothetical protein